MAKRRENVRKTTIAEFLARDDGTETRYELDHGVPVATDPPLVPHARITANVVHTIDRHLEGRRPCRALAGAGVVISRDEQSFYVPDVVVTCEEPREAPYVEAPRLVVEILSPSTERLDETTEVPAYGRLPTVEEIWLVSAARRWALVWRRSEGGWLAQLHLRGRCALSEPGSGRGRGARRALRSFRALSSGEASQHIPCRSRGLAEEPFAGAPERAAVLEPDPEEVARPCARIFRPPPFGQNALGTRGCDHPSRDRSLEAHGRTVRNESERADRKRPCEQTQGPGEARRPGTGSRFDPGRTPTHRPFGNVGGHGLGPEHALGPEPGREAVDQHGRGARIGRRPDLGLLGGEHHRLRRREHGAFDTEAEVETLEAVPQQSEEMLGIAARSGSPEREAHRFAVDPVQLQHEP